MVRSTKIGERVLVGLGIAFLAVFGFLIAREAILAAYAMSSVCETQVFGSYPAPKGDKTAVVYMRDCGAATSFNTQISIADKQGIFNGTRYEPLFHMRGRYDLKPIWTAENVLRVDIPKDAVVLHQIDRTWGVTVVYQ